MSHMCRGTTELWGRNIIARRDELGITQKQLAEAVGVSIPSVCRWERGNAAPTDFHKMKLASVLEIDPRFLFPLVMA